ncbi:MAG: molecular chaperone TorD family protein [Coriobacteriales bacterium]|jgi:TorA maturation chaperone TorD|nr:molecular chaperone TorD family protein [Coriobacteriales bacterium]
MPEKAQISVLLAGRAGVYRVLQNLLGNEPTAETVEQLNGMAAQAVLSLFASDKGEYQQALGVLFAVAKDCQTSGPDALERLQNSFTRLFVGPGKVEADPWESYYATNNRVLFQESTLEVRKAYVAQGFIPQSYPHVADDHIALELDFMAQLAQRALDSFMAGDSEKTASALAASKNFLDTHLLAWVPLFADHLAHAKHAGFYGEVGHVLEAFLPIDYSALDETGVL